MQLVKKINNRENLGFIRLCLFYWVLYQFCQKRNFKNSHSKKSMKIGIVYCLFFSLLFLQSFSNAKEDSVSQDWQSFAKGEKRTNKNSNGFLYKTIGTIGWLLNTWIAVVVRFLAEGILFVVGMMISMFLVFKCLNCYPRKSGRKNK